MTEFDDGVKHGVVLERQRILDLLQNIRNSWEKPAAFHYPNELTRLMALITENTVPAVPGKPDDFIEQIRRQVCFDALADHEAVAEARLKHPTLVGRCQHHGGKCSDLLLLITKLEEEK